MPIAAPTESSANSPPALDASLRLAMATDLEPTQWSLRCAMITELYGVNSVLMTSGMQKTSGSASREAPPSMKSNWALGPGKSMPEISCTIAALKVG